MSITVNNTTITFCWQLPPNASPPPKTDYDIRLTLPNGTVTYSDDGVTTYVAPTATTQGQITYDLAVTNTGRHIVELMIGTTLAHDLQSIRRIYIVDLPAHVENGVAPNTYQGPAVDPDPEPPGDFGTFELEDIAYLDILGQTSAQLSGNTADGILDGFYQTWYKFDTGVPDLAVPLSWGDFQTYGSIREALEHATQENLRWGFLGAPAIVGEDNPYVMLDDYLTTPGEMTTTLEHVFPGETQASVFFNMTLAIGSNDTSLYFMRSIEAGSGAAPSEWDVTANDNDRIGVGLVGTKLPEVSANWSEVTTNLWSVGANTFKYDIASDGTNIYVGCNQGEIQRSTDDGVTFADCFDLAGTQAFTKIKASSSLVVAIDSAANVYTSSNGGTNWTDRGTPFGSGSVNTLDFFDDTTDYFIVAGNLGGTYKLFRSTDGITWTEFGASIGDHLKKAYPVIGNVGSGPEIFLFSYSDLDVAPALTKLSPTDADETSYQTPPSAVLPRAFYVENGLTVWYDETSGWVSYDGTTEYTHDNLYHKPSANLNSFRVDGTNIFALYRNVLVYATATQWKTQDSMNYTKIPCAMDEVVLSGQPVDHKGDWFYAFTYKEKMYKNIQVP